MNSLDIERNIPTDEIFKKISVRPPYFALKNIKRKGREILADFIPEQSLCYNIGPITPAEAGRHLAILGTCALGLINPEGNKVYYLAKRAVLRRNSKISDLWTIENDLEMLTGKSRVIELNRKTGRVFSELLYNNDSVLDFEISYLCLTSKVFERFFKKHKKEMRKNNRVNESYNSAVQDENKKKRQNPYNQHIPLKEKYLFFNEKKMLVKLDPIRVQSCSGHFPQYPALPVAILMSAIDHYSQLLLVNYLQKEIKCCMLEADVSAENLAFAGIELLIDSEIVNDEKEFVIRSKAYSEDNTVYGKATIKYIICSEWEIARLQPRAIGKSVG